MLNKKELLTLAKDLAKIIYSMQNVDSQESRGKTTKLSFINDLLDARTPKAFIDHLSDLIKKSPESGATLHKIVEEVLIMPRDNFPLFITLVKFEYNFLTYSQEK